MAEREKQRAVPRVVLMELQIPAEALDGETQERLVAQFGALAAELTILVPVAEEEGGPKAVAKKVARTPGTFRAVARESYDQGLIADPPPEHPQLTFRDL